MCDNIENNSHKTSKDDLRWDKEEKQSPRGRSNSDIVSVILGLERKESLCQCQRKMCKEGLYCFSARRRQEDQCNSKTGLWVHLNSLGERP